MIFGIPVPMIGGMIWNHGIQYLYISASLLNLILGTIATVFLYRIEHGCI